MSYITSYPFISITVIFSLITFVLYWLVFDLRKKWKRVFGRRAPGSDDLVREAVERLLKVEEEMGALEPRVKLLERIARVSVQKVGFLRFNPFEDTGGDQSFAVALLDWDNNGVIISSLYTREGVRTYAKEVSNGVAKNPLSEEEKEVLGQAMR